MDTNDAQEDHSLRNSMEELDELILYKLQLEQKYLDLTLLAEKDMKEGYMELARSRFRSGSALPIHLKNVTPEDPEVNEGGVISAAVTIINKDNHRDVHISEMSAPNILRISAHDKKGYRKVEDLFRTALQRNIQRSNTVDEITVVNKKIRSAYKLQFGITAGECTYYE